MCFFIQYSQVAISGFETICKILGVGELLITKLLMCVMNSLHWRPVQGIKSCGTLRWSSNLVPGVQLYQIRLDGWPFGSALCKIAFLFYCNAQLCHDIATPFHFPKQVHFSVALIISCETTLFFDIANSSRIFAEFQTHIIDY